MIASYINRRHFNTIVCCAVCFLLFTDNTFAQEELSHRWSKYVSNIVDPSSTLNIIGSTVDVKGNFYVAGRYRGTIDVDPGPGVFNLTSEGVYNGCEGGYCATKGIDIFFAKYDSSGNFLFAKGLGGPLNGTQYNGIVFGNEQGSLWGYTLKVDGCENIYICGAFDGNYDFDPGPGNVSRLSGSNGTDLDGFIAKYDPMGNFVYVSVLSNARPFNNTWVSDMELDSQGGIYVTGFYTHAADFDPSSTTVFELPEINSSFTNSYFAKYSSATGELIFAKAITGSSDTYREGLGIEIDMAGNIILVGRFYGTGDFDPSATTQNLTSAGGTGSDGYIAKYDSSGNYIFAMKIGRGSSNNEWVGLLETDGYNNIYVSGNFDEFVDFGGGVTRSSYGTSGDIYIAKFSPSGNIIYANTIVSSNSEIPRGMTVDAAGNLYFFQDSQSSTGLSFREGNFMGQTLPKIGIMDCYIAKYNPAGNLVFAKSIVPTSTNGIATAREIHISGKSIFITGNAGYSGSFDFDLGSGTSYINASPGVIGYMARYNDIAIEIKDTTKKYCIFYLDVQTNGVANQNELNLFIGSNAPGTEVFKYNFNNENSGAWKNVYAFSVCVNQQTQVTLSAGTQINPNFQIRDIRNEIIAPLQYVNSSDQSSVIKMHTLSCTAESALPPIPCVPPMNVLSFCTLPYSFNAFEARLISRDVVLQWEGFGSQSISRFEIERSTDGRYFSRLSSVFPGEEDSYIYTDKEPSGGLYYYRIKVIDTEGRVQLSETRKVLIRREGGMELYPVPAHNRLTVMLSTFRSTARIEIISSVGQVMLSETTTRSQIQLDISGLKSGYYAVRVIRQGEVEVRPLVVK